MPQSIYSACIDGCAVPAILVVAVRRSGKAIVYGSVFLIPTKPPVLREVVRSSLSSGKGESASAFDEAAVRELAVLQAAIDAREASVLIDADGFRPTDWFTLQWWAVASQITRRELIEAARHVCDIDDSELMQWAVATSRIKASGFRRQAAIC